MPGRLYLKIFLSFIGVIIIAMFMVAILFRFTEGRKFVERFKQFANAQVVMVRTVVEDHTETFPDSPDAMQELVDKLGNAYMAKIWITDQGGNVLVKSFPEPVPTPQPDPDEDEDDHQEWKDMEGFDFMKCDDDPHSVYVTIPYGGTATVAPGVIHYFYRDATVAKHEKAFVLGLIGICVAVALLVMPISWFITRRLNTLRGVALRIANGDLSHRADVCGKDEVAKVGRALNDMADSLSRMIRGSKELTANVSHELRTPLTRIRIAEEILRQRCGESGDAHLDSIREDVDALDKLIGRLLDLSKLDLKESPFTMEEVDAVEIADAIVTHLGPIAKHRGLAMTAELPSEAVIQADGEALNTALGNIFENGVKHATENGWIIITMRQEAESLIVTMDNSHVPLPEEELAAIFEPFRRAKGTTPDGTGLGLAIAKKIIEGHGGTIQAENSQGGVRFTISLPM